MLQTILHSGTKKLQAVLPFEEVYLTILEIHSYLFSASLQCVVSFPGDEACPYHFANFHLTLLLVCTAVVDADPIVEFGQSASLQNSCLLTFPYCVAVAVDVVEDATCETRAPVSLTGAFDASNCVVVAVAVVVVVVAGVLESAWGAHTMIETDQNGALCLVGGHLKNYLTLN